MWWGGLALLLSCYFIGCCKPPMITMSDSDICTMCVHTCIYTFLFSLQRTSWTNLPEQFVDTLLQDVLQMFVSVVSQGNYYFFLPSFYFPKAAHILIEEEKKKIILPHPFVLAREICLLGKSATGVHDESQCLKHLIKIL